MYRGLLGKISIEGSDGLEKDIAYISNWSVEDTADVIEVTQLGEKYKEKLSGLQSWSASADGAVDFTLTEGQIKASNQQALFAAKHSGKPVKCKFYLDSTTNAEVYFEGDGYIESLSVDLSAEDKGNISISIAGSGKLTCSEVPTE